MKKWQAHVASDHPAGPDYEAAYSILKRLQREEQEKGWQVRQVASNAAIGSGSSTSSQAQAAEEDRRRQLEWLLDELSSAGSRGRAKKAA
eukprot:gene19804-26484_t